MTFHACKYFLLQTQVQDILLEYGLENVAEILIEGLSRVKRCTDEGRALMSLDLQVIGVCRGSLTEDANVCFSVLCIVILIAFKIPFRS